VAVTLVEPREQRLLRSIESATRQKIEIATVPTVADLRAKRMELTSTSIREQLDAGGLDDVRAVVQALAGEYEMADVAAAAVKLVHMQLADGEADERDVPAVREPDWRPAGEASRPKRTDRGPRTADHGQPTTRIFIGAGREAGIRPADLVGAITNEAGLSSRELGIVQIADRFSIVEVPEGSAEAVIEAMKRTSLRGQKVSVRRDRDN